ncbi:MAG: hypothetical protein ABIV28_02735 [Longimicrobiales bacterium]
MHTRRILVTAALLFGTARVVHAGPPWISIEFPSNPHHATTRDASFLIHAYHHTQGINTSVTGTAVGIVGGQRRTMRLDVRETALAGVYALRTPLPKDGTWVLSITMKDDNAPATALVTVDRSGSVSKVSVPSSMSRDGWVIPRAATQKDIEAALQQGLIADATTERGALAKKGAIGVPLALMLAFAALRRRRAASV